jgi:hypothetical protein
MNPEGPVRSHSTVAARTKLWCILLGALAVCSVARAQDTVSFWVDGELRELTTEAGYQLLGILPNASAEAQLALAEIGVSDFEYLGLPTGTFGFFDRQVASGTPPVGGSIRDLIGALIGIDSPSQIFWTTRFYADCLEALPWPYVDLEVAPGTTSAQVHSLVQQAGASVHAWLDPTHVLLRGPSRSVFEHIDFANSLLDAPFVVASEPTISWQYCGPSGDPTTGGGPTIPPAAGAPSPLEIPTLGELAILLLGALLAALGLVRIRLGQS